LPPLNIAASNKINIAAPKVHIHGEPQKVVCSVWVRVVTTFLASCAKDDIKTSIESKSYQCAISNLFHRCFHNKRFRFKYIIQDVKTMRGSVLIDKAAPKHAGLALAVKHTCVQINSYRPSFIPTKTG